MSRDSFIAEFRVVPWVHVTAREVFLIIYDVLFGYWLEIF